MPAPRIGTAERGRDLLACALVVGTWTAPADGDQNGNGNGNGVETIELTGIVRDFRPDHPDFDVVPPEGYGQYMWNIVTTLGGDGRPDYAGGGYKVLSQAHDADDRPICWTLCDPDLGDTQAQPDGPDTGSITSAETFNQWFRDIPGLTMSMLLTVTGSLQEDGEYMGMYEINIPQFYPIDGMLFGNNGAHNNFFTFQIDAEFVHDALAGYELMFKSDDDAWVFLNGQMIADLGGVNGSAEQWVELDRLGLVDGQTYRIHLFKADRSSDSSRFHLVTNIPLTSVTTPTILGFFD